MTFRHNSSHRSKDYDHEIIDIIPYYESFHDESLKLISSILNEPDICWILDVEQEHLSRKH